MAAKLSETVASGEMMEELRSFHLIEFAEKLVELDYGTIDNIC